MLACGTQRGRLVNSPREQVDELGFGHGIREDTGNGSDTRPEQVDFGLPFAAVKHGGQGYSGDFSTHLLASEY